MPKIKAQAVHREVAFERRADGSLLVQIPSDMAAEALSGDGPMYIAVTGGVIQLSIKKPMLSIPVLVSGEFVKLTDL